MSLKTAGASLLSIGYDQTVRAWSGSGEARGCKSISGGALHALGGNREGGCCVSAGTRLIVLNGELLETDRVSGCQRCCF